MHFSKIAVVSAFASSVSAYSSTARTFAVNHFYGTGPLLMARVDPIISPGGPSGHVHAIQGGSSFAMTMTDTQALDSNCTSSLVKNDKSNYWTPSLYFKDPINGTLEAVDMFYMNVYYFFEATTDKIEAFQPGHRMVVGDPTLRTPPKTGGQSITDLSQGTPSPVQFTCPRTNTNEPLYPANSDGLHGVGMGDPNNQGAGTGFPDQNCDGYASPLRADIHFPSCYNPAAGLDNYKENMQFPTNGNCPTGWVHTPHLFYEVYWNTPPFASRWTQGQGTQPFVLSQGDPTGYGLHADFIAGWDVTTLQQIIDNCDAGDSGMDKCPGLIGGLNDPSTSCNIVSPIKETVLGSMAALPGDNPIGQWGVPVAEPSGSASDPVPVASSAAVPAASSASAPKVSSSAAASAIKGSSPVTSASVKVTPTGIKVAGPDPTSAAAQTTAVTIQTAAPSPSPSAAPSAAPSAPSSDGIITVTVSVTDTNFVTVTVEGTPTGSASIASSTGGASTAGWTYLGCYADQYTPNRALDGIEFADVGAVSNTNCTTYCAAQGYSIAGSEYGGQCFCGNSFTLETKVDETECSMACEGDATQTCGGSLALSVYTNNAAHKIKRSVRARHLN